MSRISTSRERCAGSGLKSAHRTQDFLNYLRTTPAQERFQQLGFRDYQHNPGPLANQDNGIAPAAVVKDVSAPEPLVLRKVLDVWNTLRKPANVLLVIDSSDSMKEGVTATEAKEQTCPDELRNREPVTKYCPSKLELIKKFRTDIIAGFTDHDRVGLWTFSSKGAVKNDPSAEDGKCTQNEHCELVPIGQLNRESLDHQISVLGACWVHCSVQHCR